MRSQSDVGLHRHRGALIGMNILNIPLFCDEQKVG